MSSEHKMGWKMCVHTCSTMLSFMRSAYPPMWCPQGTSQKPVSVVSVNTCVPLFRSHLKGEEPEIPPHRALINNAAHVGRPDSRGWTSKQCRTRYPPIHSFPLIHLPGSHAPELLGDCPGTLPAPLPIRYFPMSRVVVEVRVDIV